MIQNIIYIVLLVFALFFIKNIIIENFTAVSNDICPDKKEIGESYYPRYKPWYRYVADLCTRYEYERIYPPYWNTKYDPEITSDIYYEKLFL